MAHARCLLFSKGNRDEGKCRFHEATRKSRTSFTTLLCTAARGQRLLCAAASGQWLRLRLRRQSPSPVCHEKSDHQVRACSHVLIAPRARSLKVPSTPRLLPAIPLTLPCPGCQRPALSRAFETTHTKACPACRHSRDAGGIAWPLRLPWLGANGRLVSELSPCSFISSWCNCSRSKSNCSNAHRRRCSRSWWSGSASCPSIHIWRAMWCILASRLPALSRRAAIPVLSPPPK